MNRPGWIRAHYNLKTQSNLKLLKIQKCVESAFPLLVCNNINWPGIDHGPAIGFLSFSNWDLLFTTPLIVASCIIITFFGLLPG